MKTKLTFLLSLTFLFLFSGSSLVFGDEIQDGFDAYKKKDYKEAVMFFQFSADQGDALAQLLLGLMYDEGKGTSQDFVESVKWYRRSAELGNASAQNNLGFMYAQGQGVLKDYVIAHMWFNLSFSNGSKNGLEGREMLEEKMSPSQIEKAQEMARNWMPKK
jgi:TPR repeat protein